MTAVETYIVKVVSQLAKMLTPISTISTGRLQLIISCRMDQSQTVQTYYQTSIQHFNVQLLVPLAKFMPILYKVDHIGARIMCSTTIITLKASITEVIAA